MTTTLYFTKAGDPNLQQILIAARYLNLTIATQEISKKYDPLTLVTEEGSLNQPNTILQHLSNGRLSGQNEIDKLKVWEWFEHFNLELIPLLREIYGQIQNEHPFNKEKYEYSVKELLKELDILNTHLKTRTFMVGDSATVVDISLATHLQLACTSVLNEEARKKLPNLARWFAFIRATEPFTAVLGEGSLCGKEAFAVGEAETKEKAV